MKRIGLVAAAVVATALIAPSATAVTDDELRTVGTERILFGHQSVGWNILDGVNTVYSKRGLTAPPVLDELPSHGPGLAQLEIGSNGDPASKFRDFEAAVSDQNPQVAVMKLCFVDITSGTKAKSVFAEYRQMVTRLGQSAPKTRILHMTVPLTVDDPASNKVRQRYNALVRSTYGAAVVDIARVESTRPDGSRVSTKRHGKRYYALYRGYASDEGHLNARGSARVAKVLLAELA